MVESAKELLSRAFENWGRAISGPLTGVVGLAAAIFGWNIRPWIWLTLSSTAFSYAILQAYHRLRRECDAALDGLTDKRNNQAVADALTERHAFGVHELLHKAPPRPISKDGQETFQTEMFKWNDAVRIWNEEVRQLMTSHGCSPQEIAHFWTISELRPGMLIRGDLSERQVVLHHRRVDRLKDVVSEYSRKARRHDTSNQ